MRITIIAGTPHSAESPRTRANVTAVHRTPPKLPNGALDYAYSIVRNAIHFSDNYPPGFIAGRSTIHELWVIFFANWTFPKTNLSATYPHLLPFI